MGRPRLQRRSADRVQGFLAGMLVALGLLTAVAAAATAVRLYDEGLHRIDVEARERVRVQAVLLEPAPGVLRVGGRVRVIRRTPVTVAVAYTTPNGVERHAETRVLGPLRAGATVPVWADRSGAVTEAPARGLDVAGRAAAGALGVLAVGAVVLGGAWAGIREAVLRIEMARWGREWEQVGPRWSASGPGAAPPVP